jgi:biotin-(acetyl-CoA carboxylase) ligase
METQPESTFHCILVKAWEEETVSHTENITVRRKGKEKKEGRKDYINAYCKNIVTDCRQHRKKWNKNNCTASMFN